MALAHPVLEPPEHLLHRPPERGQLARRLRGPVAARAPAVDDEEARWERVEVGRGVRAVEVVRSGEMPGGERLRADDYVNRKYREVRRSIQGGMDMLARRRAFPIFG